ncbi:hypothetical protein LSAT2_005802 [Lamellibrachia satsuma]|nr:hypothetical protein LSAT2_005802 [Lamellibrachia satsuma]
MWAVIATIVSRVFDACYASALLVSMLPRPSRHRRLVTLDDSPDLADVRRHIWAAAAAVDRLPALVHHLVEWLAEEEVALAPFRIVGTAVSEVRISAGVDRSLDGVYMV